MKKKVMQVLGAVVVVGIIAITGYRVGYNEGALQTAYKYNNIADGTWNQFGHPTNNWALKPTDETAKKVLEASNREMDERWGKHCVYTGKFLVVNQ